MSDEFGPSAPRKVLVRAVTKVAGGVIHGSTYVDRNKYEPCMMRLDPYPQHAHRTKNSVKRFPKLWCSYAFEEWLSPEALSLAVARDVVYASAIRMDSPNNEGGYYLVGRVPVLMLNTYYPTF